MARPRVLRPFSQRATLGEIQGCFAITQKDALVVVEEWEKTTYWGAKVLRVKDASPGPGCKFSWLEEEENLTPAFPEDKDWLEQAQALRAQFQSHALNESTAPASVPAGRARL